MNIWRILFFLAIGIAIGNFTGARFLCSDCEPCPETYKIQVDKLKTRKGGNVTIDLNKVEDENK